MADQGKQNNKDAQSGEPVQLDKEPQGGKQGGQQQGGQQAPGREQQQGGKR
ncbi:MAG TPA: hypothetical protein VFL90_03800 [Methylomirabilota bacterium]|nr:hypothetical protein [Methylomirabilota bacterium]